MKKKKEILFDHADKIMLGDPNEYLNCIKERHKKINPLIRTILLLKLGDLEMIEKGGEKLD